MFTSIAFAVSQETLRASFASRSVLPVSEITKDEPAGTGILLAIAAVIPVLLSKTLTVSATWPFVLFAKVPPIKIVFVLPGDV